MSIGSVDDLLQAQTQPEPENEPEQQDLPPEPESEPEIEPESKPETETEAEIDEYGNEIKKTEKKLYTEDEVNERINHAVRERVARFERNKSQATEEPRREDYASDADWQRELKNYIKNTLTELTYEQQQNYAREIEAREQARFEQKLISGMAKFNDFVDVVSKQPIDDAMTVATRGMEDPAAFLYAAAKRHPEDLERIYRIQDPIKKMAEMVRLDERMRKAKSHTQAPKPLSTTREDSAASTYKDNRKPTIEELIADAERKKLQKLRATRK